MPLEDFVVSDEDGKRDTTRWNAEDEEEEARGGGEDGSDDGPAAASQQPAAQPREEGSPAESGEEEADSKMSAAHDRELERAGGAAAVKRLDSDFAAFAAASASLADLVG